MGELAAGSAVQPRLAPDVPSPRLTAIDLLRGAIMALMVVDHVRVFAGVRPGGPDPAVFFTRWITHFCAPGFVFFAGVAAFLHGEKLGSRVALSRWLVLRGLWLIVLELTWMRWSWTFNLQYQEYLLAGVLWAIGWSMIALGGLVFLPPRLVGAIGLSLIALHDLADPHLRSLSAAAQGSRLGWLWQILYFGGSIGPLVILYSLIPWIGVIAAGWAFGPILQLPAERRGRICLAVGGGAIAAFLVLRGFDLYGDPRPFHQPGSSVPALLRFLNTNKYPASLLFLLMTLGPLIALIPFAERARGPVARILVTLGKAPLFFYVVHVPLIHGLALLVSLVRERRFDPWLFENHPMGMSPAPEGYRFSLWLLYAVAAIALAILVPLSGWYVEQKRAGRARWPALF